MKVNFQTKLKILFLLLFIVFFIPKKAIAQGIDKDIVAMKKFLENLLKNTKEKEDPEGYAKTLGGLSVIDIAEGNPKMCMQKLNRAITILEKNNLTTSVFYAQFIWTKGRYLFNFGEIQNAKQHYEKSITLAGKNPLSIMYKTSLLEWYYHEHDFVRADSLIDVIKQMNYPNKNDIYYGKFLITSAEYQVEKGGYEEAFTYMEKAEMIMDKNPFFKKEMYLDLQKRKADLYLTTNQPQKADSIITQIITQKDQIYHAHYAKLRLKKIGFEIQQKYKNKNNKKDNHKNTITPIKKLQAEILDIKKELHRIHHPEYTPQNENVFVQDEMLADSYLILLQQNIANTTKDKKEILKLDTLLNEALIKIKNVYSEQNFQYANYVLLYALFLQTENKIPESKKYAEIYFNILEQHHQKNFWALSQKEKLFLFQKYDEGKSQILSFLKNDKTFIERCYTHIVHQKNILFEQNKKIKQFVAPQQRQQLSDLTTQIHKIIQSSKINYPKTLSELEYEKNELEKKIALKIGKNIINTSLFDVAHVKDKLQSDEAMLEIVYNHIENVFVAFVVKKNEPISIVELKITQQDYKNYIQNIENQVLDKYSYDIFWKPFEKNLVKINKVYFSPDNLYHFINPANLFNPLQKKYVAQYLQIFFVNSSQELLETEQNTQANLLNSAVLLGEVPYKSHILLPNTLHEIQLIDTLLQKNNIKTITLVKQKTTTQDLKQNIKNPSILHLATHGYYWKTHKSKQEKDTLKLPFSENLLKNNLFLCNGIVLSNQQTDEYFSASDILQLPLQNTSVVVISACKSNFNVGSFGQPFGMPRAFREAGAKYVIASMCDVPDNATKLFMEIFYTYLIKEKKNISEAFFLTQKKCLGNEKNPNPVNYWGAFVLIGK